MISDYFRLFLDGPSTAVLVQTDPGFPEPHAYIAAHSTANDPSDNYVNAPAIWPKRIGYGCNRTLGCPGHGAGVLQPLNPSIRNGTAQFMLLASARPGPVHAIPHRNLISGEIS